MSEIVDMREFSERRSQQIREDQQERFVKAVEGTDVGIAFEQFMADIVTRAQEHDSNNAVMAPPIRLRHLGKGHAEILGLTDGNEDAPIAYGLAWIEGVSLCTQIMTADWEELEVVREGDFVSHEFWEEILNHMLGYTGLSMLFSGKGGGVNASHFMAVVILSTMTTSAEVIRRKIFDDGTACYHITLPPYVYEDDEEEGDADRHASNVILTITSQGVQYAVAAADAYRMPEVGGAENA